MSAKNKQSKTMGVLLVSIVLIGGFSYVWRQNQINQELKQKAVLQELLQVQQKKDEEIFLSERESIQQQLLLRKNGIEDAIDQAVQKSDTSIEELSSSIGQREMLRSLYEENNDNSLLAPLFKISLDLRKFDDALVYLEAMQSSNINENIDVQKYLYALFNSKSLNSDILDRFKKVVDNYEKTGLISAQDKGFYYGLISLTRGELSLYETLLEPLRGTSYDERVNRYDQALQRTESFVDTPEYYLQGLLSIGLFQQEWYRPVQYISRNLINQDPKYILAYQLNAYTALLLSERNEALESLDFLKKTDLPNKELYLYLQGVAFYHLERYQEALLAFNQLDDETIGHDARRYQYLSYAAINDRKGVLNSLQYLIRTDDLNAYDYYSIFELLFFDSNGSQYIQSLQSEITSLMESCYEQVSQDLVYVCLYGKAGLNIGLGNKEAAYQYLTHASKWFPNKDLYELLGDLAQELNNTQDATKRYIKAITSTGVINEQTGLRNKIKTLMQ